MRKIVAISCAILSLQSISQAFGKEVALTIDDAPLADSLIYTGNERTGRFISVLKKERIQAAFFCNPSRLSEANGSERLTKYANAGHFIANHTFSHPSLSKTSAEKYIEEIDKADEELRHFSTFKKWFRYPFLKEGRSIHARDKVRQHLRETGYINGYVTVDNYDYVINASVQKGLKRKLPVDREKACKMLSDLTLDGLEDQHGAAKKALGQEVTQVLLMHENDIEAFCLDKTIQRLMDNGWQIVSPEKAFAQTALQREPETLWLDQGRINAIIAERLGQKHKLKWDDTATLNAELNRRGIVTGLKAD